MKEPKLYSPLVLAYIGDAVYEIYIRENVLKAHPDMPAGKLHKENIKYVKAAAQARAARLTEQHFTEDEDAVYRRGRNAKSPTVPKNADVLDYRCATGLEAVLGYLKLCGREDRISELMAMIYGVLEDK